jgi:hypothetical protein
MTKYNVFFAGHFEIEAPTPEEAETVGIQILQDAFPEYDNLPYKDWVITNVKEIEED